MSSGYSNTFLKGHEFKIPGIQSSAPSGFVSWSFSGLVLANLRFQWFNDQSINKCLGKRNWTSADYKWACLQLIKTANEKWVRKVTSFPTDWWFLWVPSSLECSVILWSLALLCPSMCNSSQVLTIPVVLPSAPCAWSGGQCLPRAAPHRLLPVKHWSCSLPFQIILMVQAYSFSFLLQNYSLPHLCSCLWPYQLEWMFLCTSDSEDVEEV